MTTHAGTEVLAAARAGLTPLPQPEPFKVGDIVEYTFAGVTPPTGGFPANGTPGTVMEVRPTDDGEVEYSISWAEPESLCRDGYRAGVLRLVERGWTPATRRLVGLFMAATQSP